MHFTLTAALVVCLALALAAAGAEAAIPRPEHPRPDFMRADWVNLNGAWQFEVDEKGDGAQRGLTHGKDLASTITVPFCPESKLSGVGNRGFMEHVWYRRKLTIPPTMRGKRLLLHFGAVDWLARVYLNGTLLAEHRGGYAPFTVDITSAATQEENDLVVQVTDETRSGKQATGKQAHEPESNGCVYTRTTGIWQTVWLEATGRSYLRSFTLTPDLDGGRVVFQGWVDGPSEGVKVRLRAYAGERLVGEETVPAAWRSTLGVVKLKQVTPWFVGKPFLYDLTIDVLHGGETQDSVRSYFGLRKITIDGNRFRINGKAVFQRLVLDQGFYPDGIYTAATEEGLKRDIELSMEAGFNGARLHQKVFEPRLLYWADRLGYLVWGEYPSWGLNWGDYHAVADAVNEWREVMERDRNHPSIIGWCPLNETPGGEDLAAAQQLLATTQSMDPTRPFLDSSGWVHLYGGTDVYDTHDYDQNPAAFANRYALFGMSGRTVPNGGTSDRRGQYRGQPYFVSEYGGMRIHTGRDVGVAGWGYGETGLEEFLKRYKGLTDAMLDNPNMMGFCYTQLTDVEQEQNGVFFYDRNLKYAPSLLKKINSRAALYETMAQQVLDVDWKIVVPTSRETPQTWRHTTEKPAADWMAALFVDASWKEAPGGFGTEGTPGAVVRTEWKTDDIWLRRSFDLDSTAFKMAAIIVHHDEDAEVYVNGQLVASFPGFGGGYYEAPATAALEKALVVGRNVLAVHCKQTSGGQFIDVGLAYGISRR